MTERTQSIPTDHYLPNAAYEALLQAILDPAPSLCPRSTLIETLGELGGVWPERVRIEAFPKRPQFDEIR